MEKLVNSISLKRGDVVLVDFKAVEGSVQSGIRPALVLCNNIALEHSPVITVVPITSSGKKRDLPVHVKLPASTGAVKIDSQILVEQLTCIDRNQIFRVLGHVDSEVITSVVAAVAIQIGVVYSLQN